MDEVELRSILLILEINFTFIKTPIHVLSSHFAEKWSRHDLSYGLECPFEMGIDRQRM